MEHNSAGFDLIIEPDADDPVAAEVLVDGVVGDRTYRFLLDTGSAITTVCFDEYTSELPTMGSSTSSGVFGTGTSDLIQLPLLQLGPLSKEGFPASRLPPGSRQRNLIGMDFLVGAGFHFLFSQQRVEVGSFDERLGDARDLFLGAKFHPYVDIVFGAARGKAVWDTGAGITVADLSFIDRHSAIFREAGQSVGTDSTGTQMQTPMFLMAGAEIGGFQFPSHYVAGVDLSGANATTAVPMDLILGYSTLALADWIFDFRERRWAISEMVN